MLAKKKIRSTAISKKLQSRLESLVWRERRLALLELGEFSPESVLPFVQKALDDDTDEVRHAAVVIVGRLKLESVRDDLIKHKILASADPALRQAAVHSLGEIGDVRDIISLTRLLSDGDWSVRNEAGKVLTRAIMELSQKVGSNATDTLIHLLFLDDSRIRPLVVQALCRRGSQALPVLREALSEPSPAMLSGIVRVLGLLADRASLQNLIELRKHCDRRVRLEVARALGYLGVPEAAAPLVRLLETHQSDVCEAAAEALTRLGKCTVPYLIEAAERSTCPRYRVRCLRLMGQFEAPEAIPILRDALRSSYFRVRQAAVDALSLYGATVLRELKPLLQAKEADYQPMVEQFRTEKSYEGRLRIIRVIGEMGNHGAVTFLKEVRDSARSVKGLKLRRAVNSALFDLGCGAWERVGMLSLVGRLGNGRHLDWIIRDLEHPSYYVRNRAVHAAARLNSPRAVRLLAIRAVDDPRFFIRRTALQSLGQMTHERRMQQKIALVAMKDSAPGVRAEAARVLGRLNQTAAVKLLAAGLDDSIWSVREACEIALRNFGSGAAKAVGNYLDSDREIVRLRVARLLGKLKNPTLRRAIMKQRRKETAPNVKQELDRSHALLDALGSSS